MEAAEEDTEDGSLVRITAAVGSSEGLAPAVRLLALALKGSLAAAVSKGNDAALGPEPLTAINVDGSPALVTPLLHAMLVPRVALQTALLRQVAVELGAYPAESAELVELVAGIGCALSGTAAAASSAEQGYWHGADYNGLALFFSRFELQQLLEFERGTAVLAMRNDEQRQPAPL